MRLSAPANARQLRLVPLALALVCACGCAGFESMRAPPPAQHNESTAEDRDTVAAVFMAGMFQSMQHLAQAGPAEQAEIIASAREAYDRAPQQGGAKLRYALLLATPGHPARNPVLAQKLLRELAAQPEVLQPPERAVTLVELAQINGELQLRAENEHALQAADLRGERERNAAAQHRLQAEMDENARLRKQVEDAQAKLDAIANIERNMTATQIRQRGRSAVTQPVQRKARILVVDDDPGLLRLLTIRLRAENYDVEAVENGVMALAAVSRFRPDLVISDLRMDQLDGIGLLKELQNRWPGLKVILLTAHGTIPDAVQATQMGAFGFLTKPVEKQELLDQVQKALKISGFVDTDQDWRSDLITRSPIMEEKLAQAHMVAGTDARVLITGESGTGKELLARAIHKASPRRNKPFVSINCSAMAENMLESELFGHVKGAASGAAEDHRGLFQTAEGGTLLLDEVGDLSMGLQVQAAAAAAGKRHPSGREQREHPDQRAGCFHRRIADMQQLLSSGQFREDLYYRLNVVHIELPPLNRRREDIPLLVAHFLAAIAQESGTRKIYAPEAVELLATSDWPGNVRQLQNVVYQNVALSQAPIIPVELVQQSLRRDPGVNCPPSMRRATSSRAATSRRSCRLPAATSARRRDWPSATAPISTSCSAGTSWCRTISRHASGAFDAEPVSRCKAA